MAGPVQLAGDFDDLCLGSADARREACLVAGRDVSTRESNLGYIRRTIKAALGPTQARKVRGPLLDTLYARLTRCGNLACTGKPFTDHRNIPDLRPDPADRRLEWEQVADRVRAAIRSGQLIPGHPAVGARPGHDCTLSGCRPHVCKPMTKGTIHAILSGAFEAAMRWEWTDRNPAASARPPTSSRTTILATAPKMWPR